MPKRKPPRARTRVPKLPAVAIVALEITREPAIDCSPVSLERGAQIDAALLRAFTDAAPVRGCKAFHSNDEKIIITDASGNLWVMQIGSDDDEFLFTRIGDGRCIAFDYPPDWPTD